MSKLCSLSPTVYDDSDDIPIFLLDLFFIEPTSQLTIQDSTDSCDNHSSLNESDAEQLLDLSDDLADELYTTIPEPTPTDPIFEHITDEEILTGQLSDEFCLLIQRRLNEGVLSPFFVNDNSFLPIHSPYGEQIVVPHVLKAKVLHINHYLGLATHSGGRKMYHSIRRFMYWPARSIACYGKARKFSTCAKNKIKIRQNVN